MAFSFIPLFHLLQVHLVDSGRNHQDKKGVPVQYAFTWAACLCATTKQAFSPFRMGIKFQISMAFAWPSLFKNTAVEHTFTQPHNSLSKRTQSPDSFMLPPIAVFAWLNWDWLPMLVEDMGILHGGLLSTSRSCLCAWINPDILTVFPCAVDWHCKKMKHFTRSDGKLFQRKFSSRDGVQPPAFVTAAIKRNEINSFFT